MVKKLIISEREIATFFRSRTTLRTSWLNIEALYASVRRIGGLEIIFHSRAILVHQLSQNTSSTELEEKHHKSMWLYIIIWQKIMMRVCIHGVEATKATKLTAWSSQLLKIDNLLARAISDIKTCSEHIPSRNNNSGVHDCIIVFTWLSKKNKKDDHPKMATHTMGSCNPLCMKTRISYFVFSSISWVYHPASICSLGFLLLCLLHSGLSRDICPWETHFVDSQNVREPSLLTRQLRH